MGLLMGINMVLLVVTGSVASKFESFSGKVFKYGSEVMVVVMIDTF